MHGQLLVPCDALQQQITSQSTGGGYVHPGGEFLWRYLRSFSNFDTAITVTVKFVVLVLLL